MTLKTSNWPPLVWSQSQPSLTCHFFVLSFGGTKPSSSKRKTLLAYWLNDRFGTKPNENVESLLTEMARGILIGHLGSWTLTSCQVKKLLTGQSSCCQLTKNQCKSSIKCDLKVFSRKLSINVFCGGKTSVSEKLSKLLLFRLFCSRVTLQSCDIQM